MVPPSHEVATKALEFEKGQEACDAWLRAANLYSIAAYPFIKGDELADQAIVLACKAYDSAAKFSQYQLKNPIQSGWWQRGLWISSYPIQCTRTLSNGDGMWHAR